MVTDPQQGAFITKMYKQMQFELYLYARKHLPNDSLAEEAVQETFRIACQKPDDLCNSEWPEGWLVQTLKYVIANMHRQQKSAGEALTQYLSSKYTVNEDIENIDLLYGPLAETDDFVMLKEMVLEGRSHLEMAAKRGITIEASRKKFQRAKENLRKKIKL